MQRSNHCRCVAARSCCNCVRDLNITVQLIACVVASEHTALDCAGPDWKSFVLTQLLVLLPIGLFFGWVIVDMDDDELPPVIVISLAVLCAFTFIALLLTGLKNPGVIKRHSPRATPDLCAPYISSFSSHAFRSRCCYILSR